MPQLNSRGQLFYTDAEVVSQITVWTSTGGNTKSILFLFLLFHLVSGLFIESLESRDLRLILLHALNFFQLVDSHDLPQLFFISW